ncbi:hypothetical protein QBC34DRAFT_429021 [Podospora aff. communis PSN243]|uniref:Uncharacterized protein n=1 Tax=Podospora aff. communis PSN243 TaxID=3040156 RepID=A0AAV9GEA1_9PEZI|nr:hypothetical protein QBC34DRAFT_429021 [Podospora aff. communis PSN243]
MAGNAYWRVGFTQPSSPWILLSSPPRVEVQFYPVGSLPAEMMGHSNAADGPLHPDQGSHPPPKGHGKGTEKAQPRRYRLIAPAPPNARSSSNPFPQGLGNQHAGTADPGGAHASASSHTAHASTSGPMLVMFNNIPITYGQTAASAPDMSQNHYLPHLSGTVDNYPMPSEASNMTQAPAFSIDHNQSMPQLDGENLDNDGNMNMNMSQLMPQNTPGNIQNPLEMLQLAAPGHAPTPPADLITHQAIPEVNNPEDFGSNSMQPIVDSGENLPSGPGL